MVGVCVLCWCLIETRGFLPPEEPRRSSSSSSSSKEERLSLLLTFSAMTVLFSISPLRAATWARPLAVVVSNLCDMVSTVSPTPAGPAETLCNPPDPLAHGTTLAATEQHTQTTEQH